MMFIQVGAYRHDWDSNFNWLIIFKPLIYDAVVN